MVLFSVGWPTSVTEVVMWRGPSSFWSALSVWWVTGSLLAVVQPAPKEVPVGATLNLTDFELPKTCSSPGDGAVAGAAALPATRR